MKFVDSELRLAAYGDLTAIPQYCIDEQLTKKLSTIPSELTTRLLSEIYSDVARLALRVVEEDTTCATDSALSITGGRVVVEQRLVIQGFPVGKWHPYAGAQPIEIPGLIDRMEPS